MLIRIRIYCRVLMALFSAALLLLIAAFIWNYVRHPDIGAAPIRLRLLLAGLTLVGPAWALLRCIRPSRRAAAPWLALVASLILFLSWLTIDDEALRYTDDHPALRSDFPEAAATHVLVLRYAKGTPDSLYPSFVPTKLKFPTLSDKPADREKWIHFVTENRSEIESHWAELAPLRSWFNELAAQPRLGDLIKNFDDPIPAFGPMRDVALTAAAHASLLALDGKRDEAIGTLVPIFDAAQKLETHARSLVRRMIAISLQRQTIGALELILDQGEISETTRRELALVLRISPETAAEGARLLFLGEFSLQKNLMLSPKLIQFDSGETSAFSGLGPRLSLFFYNPKATVNLFGDIVTPMAEAGASRSPSVLRDLASQLFTERSIRHFCKNSPGKQLLEMSIPAYKKVVESYWQTHDRRIALLVRL